MWWITVDSQAPSTLAAFSGIALASPATMPGYDWARIAWEGSTATTSMPHQSVKATAHIPVPAPRSSSRIPGLGPDIGQSPAAIGQARPATGAGRLGTPRPARGLFAAG